MPVVLHPVVERHSRRLSGFEHTDIASGAVSVSFGRPGTTDFSGSSKCFVLVIGAGEMLLN